MSASRRIPNLYSAVPTPTRDHRDREQLAHRGQRVNLAETYHRDRRDRLVKLPCSVRVVSLGSFDVDMSRSCGPDVSPRPPLLGPLLRVLAHSWHTGG
jgi:hypothetical protein